MTVLFPFGRLAMAVAVASIAGCAGAMTGPGEDRATGSNATAVTWEDGKPAYAISCNMAAGCQERANAMCRSTFGNYTTLKSENMPTAGAARSVMGPPSVVIRCG